MALHDSLRELVSVRGAGVVDEAEELRGALDDFLAEDEATLGELNLLVDAVRLGALRRALDVMNHGAAPEAAVREAGAALARDRGTDDPTRSCWAIAALCFAVGKVDESLVRTFRSDAGTMPAPAPPTGPHGRPPAPVPDVAPGPAAPVSTTGGIPATPTLEDPPVPVESQPAQPPPPPSPTVESQPAPPPSPTVAVQPAGTDYGRGPVPPVIPEQRPSRAGMFLLVVLVALILGGLVAAGVILLRSGEEPGQGDDTATSDSPVGDGTGGPDPRVVPESVMLVPYVEGDVSRVFAVDAFTGEAEPVTPDGVDARLPTISPDRSVMTYQVGQSPSVVMVVDLATRNGRPLFAEDGPCARAGRPAWSPDGARLAVLCDPGGDGESDGIWLANADGSGVEGPVVDNADVTGSPTWISDTEFVYGVDDDATDSTFWRTDIEGGSGEQLPIDIPGHLSHIDWSQAAGRLLLLVSPSDAEEGAIYTVNADGSDPVLVDEGPFAHPVWAPAGDAIGVTLKDASGTEVLGLVSLDDPANPVVVPNPPPGEVGIPVWGTR
ncbi:TolB family protein [Nocardioides antri]|uniref:Uncharacterized protein n=1 Tax=Nocardioides antri TaxID=2607659 RepID=A0A5B1LTI9_9ACTN|nr:hypothetical protein [Nocardioides antri]KAA1424195.1 hypothetical protein F0U47_19570 [Nocardioides antri]